MFERFDEGGRRVVVYAQEECRLLHHAHIGTEHLLLGLLRDGDEQTARVLQAAGVTAQDARRRIEDSHGRRAKEPTGHIPFTPETKRVLELSLREAQRLGQEHIAQPHLLLGLLRLPESAGVRILVDLGVDLAALAPQVDALAMAAEPGKPSGGVRAVSAGPGDAGRFAAPRWRRAGSGHRLQLLVDELAQERFALEHGLRRYGRHDDNCDPERECTCGLASLLDRYEADSGEG